MTGRKVEASGNLVAPTPKIGGSEPPHTYLGMAVAYRRGYEALHESKAEVAIPKNLLAAHALECGLKAYLSRDGSDKRLREFDIRHNLVVMWEMAQEEGLKIETPLPGWVVHLGELYGPPYHLRYATGVNGLVMPSAKKIVEGTTFVIDEVWMSITGSPYGA